MENFVNGTNDEKIQYKKQTLEIYDKLILEINWSKISENVPHKLCMFLALKTVLGNKQANDLYPQTSDIEKLWQKAILNTEFYRQIEKVCGTYIVHDLDRCDDESYEIKKRLKLTNLLIKAIFK
jgi:hypothetical protein